MDGERVIPGLRKICTHNGVMRVSIWFTVLPVSSMQSGSQQILYGLNILTGTLHIISPFYFCGENPIHTNHIQINTTIATVPTHLIQHITTQYSPPTHLLPQGSPLPTIARILHNVLHSILPWFHRTDSPCLILYGREGIGLWLGLGLMLGFWVRVWVRI